MATTEMTLREAAAVLGIPEAADRATINKASRRLIARYHPDAWRDKPPAEQKKAEQKFMQVNAAKKIMLDPSLALPEDEPAQGGGQGAGTGGTTYGGTTYARNAGGSAPYDRSSTSYEPTGTGYGRYSYSSMTNGAGGGVRQGATGQGRTMRVGTGADNQRQRVRSPRESSATAGSASGGREKFNRARSFAFGQQPDAAEQQIAKQVSRETRGRYRQALDVIRVTSSAISTVAFVALAIYLVTSLIAPAASSDQAAGVATYLPFVLTCVGIAVAKLLAYDMIASFYVARALRSRLNKGTLLGIEGMLLSVVGAVVFWPTQPSLLAYGIMFVTSLVLVTASAIVRAVSNRDDGRKASAALG